MVLAQLPMEGVVVIGVILAAMVLACLKVMGSEVEHETALRALSAEARRIRNARYRMLVETQRAEQERRERLTRKPWLSEPTNVDVLDEPDAELAQAA